jgi:hypothetical protein
MACRKEFVMTATITPTAAAPAEQRARQARCGVCWAGPGEPCGDARGDLPGLHLARFAAARRGGLITATAAAAAIEAAGTMFTGATVIPASNPGGTK